MYSPPEFLLAELLRDDRAAQDGLAQLEFVTRGIVKDWIFTSAEAVGTTEHIFFGSKLPQTETKLNATGLAIINFRAKLSATIISLFYVENKDS